MGMPVVVVATLTVDPESVGTVRDFLRNTVAQVHTEPGCQLYSLHETGNTFVFVEQWADPASLKTHGASATTIFNDIGGHLTGEPEISVLTPVAAGDPEKGQLRP
jgi:quinol monooxygenase YgiN